VANQGSVALLLEGDDVLRDVLSEVLEDAGFTVVALPRFSEAIEVVQNLRLTVVIADSWDLSGNVLTEEGRQRIAQLTVHAPTMLLTTDSFLANTDPADLGFVCALPQPLILEEFEAALTECMRQARRIASGGDLLGATV
jgi:DNA-binding response OmpR family regulator